MEIFALCSACSNIFRSEMKNKDNYYKICDRNVDTKCKEYSITISKK